MTQFASMLEMDPTDAERTTEPEQPPSVRRNTIVALVFLLAAIAIAGTLGVIRIYQMGV